MSIELVSREDELAVIDGFLDRSTDEAAALVLRGEPGIGKSTLWLAGVESARTRGFRVLVSRPAETEQTLPNVVLGDLFGDVTPGELAALPPPRRRAFESALLLQEAPGIPVDPRALGVAIVTLMQAPEDGRPILLAVDDDQWLDPSSAGTLHFALRRLAEAPVRLLLSRRSGAVAATALEHAIDPARVEELTVGPLSLGGVQLLLRRRLGVSYPRSMLVRIHDVSAGNPFYALELGRVQSTAPGRDAMLPLAIPPSLELLIGARLDALDAPTRQVLLLVAAHGRLPMALAQALQLVPGGIEEAGAANVIETEGGAIRFTHPLLASTIYQAASEEERRVAHRRLAEVVDDPVHRGHHLALAADAPSADLAATLESAADVARDRGMAIASAELAEHALRLTPAAATGDQHRRAIAAARARSSTGEGGLARTIAADLEARAAAGRQRAEVLVLRSELEPPVAAIALLEEALAESAGIPELQSAIHTGLAEAGFFGSAKPFRWSVDHARAALEEADAVGDDALRADALAILATLRFGDRDPEALDLAQRAYRLATSLPDLKHAARAVWSLALVLTWLGDVARARDWLEGRLREWTERDEHVRQDLLWYLALVEVRAGRWAVASRHADEVLEMTARYGIDAPYDRFPAALVALHRGAFETARAHARYALALGEGMHLEFYHAVLATCDLWSGRPEASLASFEHAEDAADAIGEHEPSMRFWRAEYVEALLQAGRIDEAARLLDDWEASAQVLGRQHVLAQATRCRGLIAAARGDLPSGATNFQEAADLHAETQDAFGRGRALLALGATLRRMRQKRTARQALDAALAAFDELGAASWAAAASEELSRIGGRRRIEGLSPSEESVAKLVARGQTNREIAAALFLGERTVASHLTHVYAKLGVRSRTELARLLPRGEERPTTA